MSTQFVQEFLRQGGRLAHYRESGRIVTIAYKRDVTANTIQYGAAIYGPSEPLPANMDSLPKAEQARLRDDRRPYRRQEHNGYAVERFYAVPLVTTDLAAFTPYQREQYLRNVVTLLGAYNSLEGSTQVGVYEGDEIRRLQTRALRLDYRRNLERQVQQARRSAELAAAELARYEKRLARVKVPPANVEATPQLVFIHELIVR